VTARAGVRAPKQALASIRGGLEHMRVVVVVVVMIIVWGKEEEQW
jgi:hypothetical protein